MPNTITITFIPCTPAPANGYKLFWRVAGTLDDYTDGGFYTESPIIFVDELNPEGTCYEGTLQSDCSDSGESGQVVGNAIPWATACEESGFDNSSCGDGLGQVTASLEYVNLGFFDLHVSGSAGVNINYDVNDRPNRFTLYDNGSPIDTSGWKGTAPYAGPWGVSLSTAPTGTLSFVPVLGHDYKLLVEVGPAGPPPYDVSDNFSVSIVCT